MIRILTDSTSDLSPARAQALGVEVLPLSVHFGEETFRDGVDITNEGFYDRLAKAETLPTTSQVPPETFLQTFQRIRGEGDQILGIFLSGAMSGTCQSAMIARQIVGGEGIAIVDSRTVTFALGLLVETACMEELVGKVRLLAVVDTLKYLKMGGRISGAAAVVGGLLGICPIITIRDGLVASVGKGRGRKAGFQFIAKWLDEKEPIDGSLPVSFGHTNAPKALEECMAYFAGRTAGQQVFPSDIGAVVGTHTGPGAAGIAFYTK